MYLNRQTVDVVTAADGSATAYSAVVNGRVLSIQYVKDATTPFSDGVDFTVTGEITGTTLWSELNVNASKAVAPREQVHSTAGVGLTYDGTRAVCEPVGFAEERVKIVIASGGDTKKGRFYILVG